MAPADLLLVTQSDRHPCDMAMLRGARFVTAQELAPGRAWDEPKLKSLTGGDPITARFMRQDFFTYEPQFALVAAGNHKPSFKGVDEAIRRRVQLVPFLQNIPAEERDKDLPEKLKAEWPAILRWADRRLPRLAARGPGPARVRPRGERGVPERRGRARPVARGAVRRLAGGARSRWSTRCTRTGAPGARRAGCGRAAGRPSRRRSASAASSAPRNGAWRRSAASACVNRPAIPARAGVVRMVRKV